MKKILLLNGGKAFAHSNGQYNATLHDAAVAFLDRAGFDAGMPGGLISRLPSPGAQPLVPGTNWVMPKVFQKLANGRYSPKGTRCALS